MNVKSLLPGSALAPVGGIGMRGMVFAPPDEGGSAAGVGGGTPGAGQQMPTNPLENFSFGGGSMPISDDQEYEADLAAMLQIDSGGADGQGGGELDPELLSAMSMFGDPANTGVIDDTQVTQPTAFQDASPEAVKALETEITNIIKNIRIPDNALPENFDPTDRTQMQSVLSGLMRNTIAQSLSVVFRPMQLAMQTMANQIDQRVQGQITAATQGQSARQVLAETVPEVNNPQYAPMILQWDANLKSNGKKPQERAQAIRKMLNQMGFKPDQAARSNGNNRTASNPQRQQGNGGAAPHASVRQGTAALDSMFAISRKQF